MRNGWRLVRPRDMAELFCLIDAERRRPYFLAGGSDLNVQRGKGVLDPGTVLYIKDLPELNGITEEGGTVRLGAAVTVGDILRSSLLRDRLPYFVASLELFAAPGIQNMATLGGNIANGSPTADTAPLLLVLDAGLELASSQGRRNVRIRDFFTGYKQNVLGPSELITAVLIPAEAGKGFRSFYRKVGNRKTLTIAKLSLAGMARVAGGACREIRLAVGSLNEYPRRLERTENLLTGLPLSDFDLEKVEETVNEEITPISDFRSDAAYRKRVCLNLLAAFLKELKGTRLNSD